jgi:hypothetical protein
MPFLAQKQNMQKQRNGLQLRKQNGEMEMPLGNQLMQKWTRFSKRMELTQAAMFDQTIEGNGARKLVENCDAICNEIEDHVLQAPTRIAGTDEEIWHVGETHWHVLHSLDGYFSSLCTKRFHLTSEILEKAKQYRHQVLVLERHLAMSVTTKNHLCEDPSLEQQEDLDGIVDLGEDFGGRSHQDHCWTNMRTQVKRT